MGSWNATCGVSNLPILEDDMAVMFILEGRHNNMVIAGDGICESNTLYEPILPLFVKYCDYGKFEVISNKNESLMLDYIRKQFKEKRYICSKKEFDINKVDDLNKIIELIKEGYIEKIVGFDEHAPVGYMLVHKDVYDNLMKSFISEEEYNFERNRIMDSYSYTMEEAKEYERNLRECLIDSSEDKIRERIELHLMLSMEFSYTKNLKDLVKKAYLKEIDKESEEEIIRLAYFKNIMENLRKIWMPQSGCGSQYSYNSLYEKLSSIVIEKYRKYEEDCEY